MLFHGKNGCTNAPRCYVYTYIACHLVHVLHSSMKRIKRAILVKDFSAELQVIRVSYNIFPIYTLHICHIQRLMKRECLNVRSLYRSASHQHYKTCDIILPFITACIKPTYLKKTLQISWDTKFTVKLKEAILCTIVIILHWDLNKYNWKLYRYIIYYICLICEIIFYICKGKSLRVFLGKDVH